MTRHNMGVEIQDVRRRNLRLWIKVHCEGKVNRFAVGVGYKQPQIAETLNGKRSFGEKLARSLENKAKMPSGYLDQGGEAVAVREPTQLYHGVQLTRAGALLAAEWEKLSVADRLELEEDIQTRVARAVRSKRRRAQDQRPPPDE